MLGGIEWGVNGGYNYEVPIASFCGKPPAITQFQPCRIAEDLPNLEENPLVALKGLDYEWKCKNIEHGRRVFKGR